MISSLYFLALIISLCSLVYLTHKKDRSTDRYLWTVLIILPVIILGYWLKTTVTTQEAAFITFCFIYLDSTILLAVAFFSLLRSIKVKINGWLKTGVYGITVFHLLTIWLSKDNNLYYKSIEIIDTGIGMATKMVSGPLKFTHYVYLGTVFLAIIIALITGLIRKGTYSKRALWAYSAAITFAMAIYVYESLCNVDFSLLPFFYAACSIYLVINFDYFESHNIHSLIGEKQSRTGLRGFIAFDRKKRLLGYNTQFASIFPEIKKVVIDTCLDSKTQALTDYITPLLDRCIEQGNYSDKIVYKDRKYGMSVSSFSISNDQPQGYLLELSDITEEEQRIELIEKYSERLGQDVKEKTAHILEIQNSVVLGMANLVENRDNNTGGHVKRTSDIIKFLVDEAVKQGLYTINEETAASIVRAAPMHDLGKMYIETSILCKPARLTDEEFKIMKTHSTKSGEMVQIILEGVEEPEFVKIAYNIARHHHERWDGKGYPEGLLGEEIPLEARIMAVADVYDALVSKRCYKEPMSYETASKIMNENMGSQFDPAMRPIFNACRKELEEYYEKN